MIRANINRLGSAFDYCIEWGLYRAKDIKDVAEHCALFGEREKGSWSERGHKAGLFMSHDQKSRV